MALVARRLLARLSSLLARLSTHLKTYATALALSVGCLVLSPCALAATFESNYFSVDLGQNWAVAGTPHNMGHSVNVNFVNRQAGSSINVVVGAGTHKPYELLTNLQQALRAQGARTEGIQQFNDLLYFEFNIGPIKGFACSATNQVDTASITIMGNPQVGIKLIQSFYNKDSDLFPDFVLKQR